ncbi:unnamed protein product, partial [Pylaiella littoralis]
MVTLFTIKPRASNEKAVILVLVAAHVVAGNFHTLTHSKARKIMSLHPLAGVDETHMHHRPPKNRLLLLIAQVLHCGRFQRSLQALAHICTVGWPSNCPFNKQVPPNLLVYDAACKTVRAFEDRCP